MPGDVTASNALLAAKFPDSADHDATRVKPMAFLHPTLPNGLIATMRSAKVQA